MVAVIASHKKEFLEYELRHVEQRKRIDELEAKLIMKQTKGRKQ